MSQSQERACWSHESQSVHLLECVHVRVYAGQSVCLSECMLVRVVNK